MWTELAGNAGAGRGLLSDTDVMLLLCDTGAARARWAVSAAWGRAVLALHRRTLVTCF
jgi:hypothetical protein